MTNTKDNQPTLSEKILKIQSEIGKLSKDKANPFFKSKYFDINAVIEHLQPLLAKHKVTVMQPLSNFIDGPAIKTIITDGEEHYTEVVPLPRIEDPQKIGSAITYYRRYALVSFFLLQAEDDDANRASGLKAKDIL